MSTDSPALRKARKRELAISKTFTPKFWHGEDSRLAVVKEIRRRVERLKRDVGCDSYQKELLCERAVFVLCQLETIECSAIGHKKPVDLGCYLQGVNALSGLLNKLGLERKVQKAGGLKAYLLDKEKRA
jgi:hypothetical protein